MFSRSYFPASYYPKNYFPEVGAKQPGRGIKAAGKHFSHLMMREYLRQQSIIAEANRVLNQHITKSIFDKMVEREFNRLQKHWHNSVLAVVLAEI